MSTSEAPAMTQAAIRKLVADSVTIALEAQAANMENTDNTTRPREAHVERQLKSENLIHHIKHYLSIVDNIRADDATRDTSRMGFFHFSFKGNAKEWLNKIPPTQIKTWDQLVAWFLDYFFPVGRTSFLRDMILRFKQGNNEPIKSAWIRFQDLIKQVPHHGIQKWRLVQIFHDNISQKDRGKLDQFAHFISVLSSKRKVGTELRNTSNIKTIYRTTNHHP
ncbi:zinc finger, CCHC-type containing protein [Tanacetum coccineum]